MIIDAMGYFWWDDKAPNPKITPGQLSIDDRGVIKLEMHDRLGGSFEDSAIFGAMNLTGVQIRGELKKSGKKVLLKQLGTLKATAGRVTYVTYTSKCCLISDSVVEDDRFSGLIIPLQGLEAWYRPGDIDIDHPSNDIKNISLKLSSGVTWDLFDVTAGLHAKMEYVSNKIESSDELLNWLSDFEDLVSLLANSNTSFKWPALTWETDNSKDYAGCYFPRNYVPDNNLQWHKVLLPMERIKVEFGEMLKNWITKRKTLGPGINLFLGAVKNNNLYAEHQFVNMIWGLETLNRRNELAAGESSSDKIAEKAERIFKLIDENNILDKKDRTWLKKRLLHVPERSLAERLYDLISIVSFDVDKKLLRLFCEKCASLRNDLSHHGGERTPGEYDVFIQSISPRIKVLRKFYFLIIMSEIGLDEMHLRWIIQGHPDSYAFRHLLRNVDLLTEDQKKNLH
jgi:hypothetical protein